MVYAFIPELRNHNGKCVICYVSCLMINLICLALIISLQNLHEENLDACIVLGYFFMTSSWMTFMWLNVLAFDIWSAFSTSYNRNQGKRFAFYCAYAFGVSIALIFLIFILHNFDLIPLEYQHKIGNGVCLSATDKLDTFIYTYLPIIYTVILNTVLFSMAGYEIHKMKKFDVVGKKHSENEKDR